MRSTAILTILNVCPYASPGPNPSLPCGEWRLIIDDTPRAGNFEPLAFLPKNKSVVLGLISSKLADLEDPKQIAGRVDEAAKIMGDPSKSRICLSPQCGFASHIEGNKVRPSAGPRLPVPFKLHVHYPLSRPFLIPAMRF